MLNYALYLSCILGFSCLVFVCLEFVVSSVYLSRVGYSAFCFYLQHTFMLCLYTHYPCVIMYFNLRLAKDNTQTSCTSEGDKENEKPKRKPKSKKSVSSKKFCSILFWTDFLEKFYHPKVIPTLILEITNKVIGTQWQPTLLKSITRVLDFWISILCYNTIRFEIIPLFHWLGSTLRPMRTKFYDL